MIYTPAPFVRPHLEVISTFSEEALGMRGASTLGVGSSASRTWVANLAVFVPFGISQPFTVREVFWFNGSTAGNNIDVGVYATDGTRLFSLGSTAQGAASSIVNSTTLTDYTLEPGDYFMAYANDGTTNDAWGWAPTATVAAALGVGQMAAAFALPAPATIVPLTNALLPYFGLNGYTVAL